MNNLEICKRIAEIENIDVCYDDNTWYGENYYRKRVLLGVPPQVYNPLRDDELAFQLMVKYSVELSPLFCDEWCASVVGKCLFKEDPLYDKVQAVVASPNKAICLAIIEKFRGAK